MVSITLFLLLFCDGNGLPYASAKRKIKNQVAIIISDHLRQKMLSVKSIYQYPDTQTGDEDAFAREPFVVWFSSPKTGEKK